MLTLIEGSFFGEKDEYIKKALTERCASRRKSFLIVPEQQTVLSERLTAGYLPPDAPLFFEATNFTRFTDSMFRSLGGLCTDAPTKEARALVMWQTLGELSPFIDLCRGTEVTATAVERAMSAVSAAESLGIAAADLDEARVRIEKEHPASHDRLKKKLSDLSAVMTLYSRLLGERLGETKDPLIALTEKLRSADSGILENVDIYVDGFTSFTEPQYNLLRSLFSLTNVYITLTLPRYASDALEYAETKKAHEKLIKSANESGIPVRLVRLSEKSDATPVIQGVCSSLWHTGAQVDIPDGFRNTMRVFEAKTPYEECDFVLSDIRRRVMEGAKYSDFAIITRSLSDYRGILDAAACRANLPVFISQKRDISSVEAIKLIYTAISSVISGFSQTDVITYSKCSLCGVSRDLADEFEIYVKTWQISGNRFTDGVRWNMNPDGYSTKKSATCAEKLIRIDEAREAIIAPLIALKESFDEAKTVREYSSALVDFLTDLSLEEKLKKKTESLFRIGSDEAATYNERVWGIICSSLDSLVKTVADTAVSAKTYLSLLKIAFSYADISRIPSYTEEITAASADTARLSEKKHVYILGLNFGAFPRSVFDDSYFTTKDSEALEEAGLPAVGDREIRSARELYFICRAISLAKESLTLSYTTGGASFEATRPSDAITRLLEITGGALSPIKISDIPVIDKVYTPENALTNEYCAEDYTAVKFALAKVGLADKTRVYEGEIKNDSARLSREITEMIYGRSILLSQSRIDRFISCPMSYFCSYNLGLKPEATAELDAAGIGSFIHAILENFFIELKVRGMKIGEISDEEKNEIVRSAAKRYLGVIFEDTPEKNARMRVNIERLCRAARPAVESLCEEFKNSKFEPVFFELKIERNAQDGPSAAKLIAEDGREIFLHGTVDRVDVYTKEDNAYVRVIDYKTGSKSFSPEDLAEGRNLQMFLYLKSITETESADFKKRLGIDEGGKIIPAGVIYVKADMTDGKIKKNDEKEAFAEALKKQARLGMLLDDDDSLYAMNTDYLPIKKDKNGALKKDEKKLYSLEGWNRINEVLEGAVKDVCKKMTSGEISALPLKRGGKGELCKYCDFKPFCRNAKV